MLETAKQSVLVAHREDNNDAKPVDKQVVENKVEEDK